MEELVSSQAELIAKAFGYISKGGTRKDHRAGVLWLKDSNCNCVVVTTVPLVLAANVLRHGAYQKIPLKPSLFGKKVTFPKMTHSWSCGYTV